MNYFKQAAGLIVLVFVLALLFVLFLDDREEKRRADVYTESVQREAVANSQLEQCIADAEQVKADTRQSRLSQMLAAGRSGYYDSLKADCLANQPTGIGNPQLTEIWEQKCVVEIEQFFLREAELDQELAEAKAVCNQRFLR